MTSHGRALRLDTLLYIAAGVLVLMSCSVLMVSLRRNAISQQYAGISAPGTVRQGSAAISLTNVRYSAGSGRYQAPAGKRYLIVTLAVRNATELPITILPSSDSYVKSAEGAVVYLTPLALDNPFRSGQLLPGETIRGELSYLVDTAARYRYYLESDWTGGVISFSIQ